MDEEYEPLELIGRGSFGEIRKVRRIRDGEILCRKEIMWKKMNKREKEQLEAEVMILAALKHKSIVRYHSRYMNQSTMMLYLYMEYCGNGDLHELILNKKEHPESGPLREETIWQIFAQLLLALYRCHNGVDVPPLEDITNSNTLGPAQHPVPRPHAAVLHRDIKPQNIFLDHNNRVKLGDFGLSKVLNTQNFAETYVGTPFYMSPEIINCRPYTSKSDIWALGCVIYELCALEPPFMAQNQIELNARIKNGRITPITQLGYSEELEKAIRACLQLGQERRPSAATLLQHRMIIQARHILDTIDQREHLSRREADLNRILLEREACVRSKEEELARREQKIHMFEQELSRNTNIMHDSAQRKLLDAQRTIDLMAAEKARLEEQLANLQTQISRSVSGGSDDSLERPVLALEERMDLFSSGFKPTSRPSLGRTQTEASMTRLEQPDSTNHISRREHTAPVRSDRLRSPARRKSQIPMSRIRDLRPELIRPPLTENPAARLSGRLESVNAFGSENVHPNSAVGNEKAVKSVAPRTPTRDLSMRTLNLSSPHRPIYPSPSRSAARTLFANPSDPSLNQPHTRVAPLAPTRAASMLEGMQKARLGALTCAAYDLDDLPSPFLKRSYTIRELSG